MTLDQQAVTREAHRREQRITAPQSRDTKYQRKTNREYPVIRLTGR